MKTRRAIFRTLSGIAIMLVALPLILGISGCSKKTITASGDYAVDAGRKITAPFQLTQGDSFKLTVNVKSGGDIEVRMDSPNGSNLLAQQRVQSKDFKLEAPVTGLYSVVLNNDYASADKTVHIAIQYPQR